MATKLMTVVRQLARGEAIVAALRASPGLATAVATEDVLLEALPHWVYRGDTLLHVCACVYAVEPAKALLRLGAGVRAKNRRGAEPLHYAADGGPNLSTWNPGRQAKMIALLLEAGA